MRSTLGIAVFSGMLGVTLFGIFLTPVFYYVVVRLGGTKPTGASTINVEAASGPHSPDGAPHPESAAIAVPTTTH
jgi:hypothetical protein